MRSALQRGIDHVVFVVRDLDAARARFARLGFTTTPRADHPFGTSNSLVQLQGNFIELLGVTDRDKVMAAGAGRFSFGRFNAEFLDRREGMTMLVFASDDARRDLAEFQSAGLTAHGPLDFSRKDTLPDGSQVTVSFSLAFVTDPRLPDAAFFVCQQHAPEHFWKPEYQRHANTAHQIAEVVLVADDPKSVKGLFGGLQRPEQVTPVANGLRIQTARGAVTVIAPADFLARFPGNSWESGSPRFGAVRLTVQDPATAEAVLKAGGVTPKRTQERLWLPPEATGGVVLEFSP
jgi:catechol 2,3-dioxygenase-like lactoylglutathione lyase family enzyme